MSHSFENLMCTDNELIQLSLENSDYFGVLIDRYEHKLRRYVQRITSVSHDDHEDILQNVFMKAYTHLNDFDPRLSCNAWLYRITHNEVIDWNRREKTKQKYGKYDCDDEIFSWTEDGRHFLQELHIKENKELIIQTLASLELKYREVLVLKFFEHASYQEMSDILKKPPGTIATLINRAKQAFKKNYEHTITR